MIALGACGSLKEARDIEGNIVSPGNFRAGPGVIESVGAVGGAKNVYGLYVRMLNSGFQTVNVDRGGFLAGEEVELTNDGRVVRVTGTDLLRALRKRD